jgi:hypothetical protein
MTRPSFAALQQRIDAAKRKCVTGYSCGAGCISMNKRCLKTPGSPAGKQKMKRVLALAAGGGEGASASPQRPAEAPATGGGGGGGAPASGSSPERGGALVAQQKPKEQKQAGGGGSAVDQKYAGKTDDASVNAYAKEKVKELLNDPKAWENSSYVKKETKDDYFGQATLAGSDAKALRSFNAFHKGLFNTYKAEVDRGHSFATDKPEDIERKLEKAKVSKSKNREKTVAKLTKDLADAKQQLEQARTFVEETYPRMNAMPNNEKVAYSKERARKRVAAVTERGMRDLKSAARGGREVAAVADFLRVEQGGRRKEIAEMLGDDVAGDREVIRAQLTGKGTAEGALGLQPGKDPTAQELKSAYRKAAAKSHPDAGGSAEEFRNTQQAYQRLKKKYNYDSLRVRLDALRARCGAMNG